MYVYNTVRSAYRTDGTIYKVVFTIIESRQCRLTFFGFLHKHIFRTGNRRKKREKTQCLANIYVFESKVSNRYEQHDWDHCKHTRRLNVKIVGLVRNSNNNYENSLRFDKNVKRDEFTRRPYAICGTK